LELHDDILKPTKDYIQNSFALKNISKESGLLRKHLGESYFESILKTTLFWCFRAYCYTKDEKIIISDLTVSYVKSLLRVTIINDLITSTAKFKMIHI